MAESITIKWGGSTPFQFSTEEQKTNMKWIDGKDIYCKSYDKTSTSSISDDTVIDSTLNMNYIDTLIDITGSANSNNDALLSIGYSFNSYDIALRVRNSGIIVQNNNLSGIKRIAFTIYYTKK